MPTPSAVEVVAPAASKEGDDGKTGVIDERGGGQGLGKEERVGWVWRVGVALDDPERAALPIGVHRPRHVLERSIDGPTRPHIEPDVRRLRRCRYRTDAGSRGRSGRCGRAHAKPEKSASIHEGAILARSGLRRPRECWNRRPVAWSPAYGDPEDHRFDRTQAMRPPALTAEYARVRDDKLNSSSHPALPTGPRDRRRRRWAGA